MSAARYAVYFAPAHGSPWWSFGAGWLGRDEQGDTALPQAARGGFSAAEVADLTAEPRRYGFHATLKAPFRLRDGVTEDLLLRRLGALAQGLHALPLGTLRLVHMDGFVALVPTPRQPGVDALAAHCMLDLDDLRAPLAAQEIARRRPESLDATGRDLLLRYGYPHVLGRFRFHLTLSGPVDADTARRLLDLLAPEVAQLNAKAPATLDRLCLFREDGPGAPFVRIRDEVLAP
jgi:putative phosphonate metabolism protein